MNWKVTFQVGASTAEIAVMADSMSIDGDKLVFKKEGRIVCAFESWIFVVEEA